MQLQGLRIGLDRDYFFKNLDADTAAVTEAALRRLEQAGATLIPASVPNLAELLAQSGFPIALFEAVRDLSNYLEEYETGIHLKALAAQTASPDVQGIFAAALGDGAVPRGVYEEALSARERLMDIYEEYFEANDLDAMAFPTTPLPPRPLQGTLETVELNGEQVPAFPTYIRNTDPASIAGVPGLSVPAGRTTNGLPVGLEIDGPAGSDRRLLAIGLAIEEILTGDQE